jgi:hypothetical protein
LPTKKIQRILRWLFLLGAGTRIKQALRQQKIF